MITYPNQKIITVFKEKVECDFLQIQNGSWQWAAQDLNYNAFKIYLYLASNKDSYSIALSYVAINNLFPMSRHGYDNAIKELTDVGYLYHVAGNNWCFNPDVRRPKENDEDEEKTGG